MASVNDMSNDTRGWVLATASAVACVFGACVICVDVFVRLIPGQKNFRIQDSNAFLSASMSLSFGVMIFSALFSMLPSSKRYLLQDKEPEQTAGFIMMGSLVAGFVGIQVVSRIIHSFMPSHVVDCDHSHGADADEDHGHSHSHFNFHSQHDGDGHHHSHSHLPSKMSSRRASSHHPRATETTPLLESTDGTQMPSVPHRQASIRSDGTALAAAHAAEASQDSSVRGANDGSRPPLLRQKSSLIKLRRPSMVEVRDRLMSFVKDTKANCDEFGPCFGYSDPCGQECKRHIPVRTPTTSVPPALRYMVTSGAATSASTTTPTTPTSTHNHAAVDIFTPVPEAASDETSIIPDANTTAAPALTRTIRPSKSRSSLRNVVNASETPPNHVEMQEGGNGAASAADAPKSMASEDGHGAAEHSDHTHESPFRYQRGRPRPLQFHYTDDGDYHDPDGMAVGDEDEDDEDLESALPAPHHHHVPTNAFMSIGLQTVLAIGLHKFPEGFITYATNHVNPELGFNVFMALFVHNIAEGFAMSLPLYMALGSRLRAILWASALGGLSQPVGAGMAAIWLKYLGRNGDGNAQASGVAYGVLFAVTAGIMVAVALQLFVEGLTLHHNRQLSITFGFIGMLILGLSNSLVKH